MRTIMQVLPSLKQGGVEVGTIEVATALTKAKIPNMIPTDIPLFDEIQLFFMYVFPFFITVILILQRSSIKFFIKFIEFIN